MPEAKGVAQVVGNANTLHPSLCGTGGDDRPLHKEGVTDYLPNRAA